MVITVSMPQMGESLAEGTVVRWLKAAGDTVARDEPLFEISTDKVDTDVPSPVAGVLKQILVREGETVAVGTAVALLEAAAGESAGAPSTPPSPSAGQATAAGDAEPDRGGHFKSDHAPQVVSFRKPAGTGAPPQEPPQQPRARATGNTGAQASRTFSPAVLDAARHGRLSLDELTGVAGSGRGGRITKRDVTDYLASRESARPAGSGPAAPAPVGSTDAIPPEYLYRPVEGDRVVPMSPVRRKIAHHMRWSTRISPHASAFAECDMSLASKLVARERDRFAQAVGAPLTFTVLAARAVVTALADFPALNASVVGDALVMKPHVNLGIAVALRDADELIVPVIRSADELTLEGMARAVADLAARARDRRLKPDDVQGGTFTLTNPGIFGGVTGTPILNQPQVAIVGLGAITKRVVVVNDAMAIRPMMTIALTFDHRAADGMQAFKFLERVRTLLESASLG